MRLTVIPIDGTTMNLVQLEANSSTYEVAAEMAEVVEIEKRFREVLHEHSEAQQRVNRLLLSIPPDFGMKRT